MVVRPEVVREKVAALREATARLRRLKKREDDEIIRWAIERGLQVAAQALFDAGNHVLAGGFSERAPDYAGVPLLLKRHGVITDELEGRLAGLAGFRNLLVHDYVRVNYDRVRELLETRLDDFDDFAEALEVWLDNT